MEGETINGGRGLEQVRDMSDETLYGALVELGASIGPVVPSTRVLYEKLLVGLWEKLEGHELEEVPPEDGLNVDTDTEPEPEAEPEPEEPEFYIEDVPDEEVDLTGNVRYSEEVVSPTRTPFPRVVRGMNPTANSTPFRTQSSQKTTKSTTTCQRVYDEDAGLQSNRSQRFDQGQNQGQAKKRGETFLLNSLVVGLVSVFGALFVLYIYQDRWSE
jgi:hypothetical protein